MRHRGDSRRTLLASLKNRAAYRCDVFVELVTSQTFRTRTKPAAAVPPFRGGIRGGAAAVEFGCAAKAACFGCRRTLASAVFFKTGKKADDRGAVRSTATRWRLRCRTV